MSFESEQEFYKVHRSQASAYCKLLSERMKELRRQLKNCERAFVVSANIKKKCELEIVPVKIIPAGMGKKEYEARQKKLFERVMADENTRNQVLRMILAEREAKP